MSRKFAPNRRRGLILHILLLVILTGCMVLAFFQAFQQASRGLLFLNLVVGALLLAPLALIAYRLYALLNASYEIDREKVRIHWGLRTEEIPLLEIEWVRPLDELGESLRSPFFSMPGAYLGSVKSPNLGEVEFMASEKSGALVVAGQAIVVVVSPENTSEFVRAFQDATEMGSLTPPVAFSAHPGAYVFQVSRDRLALGLLIGLTLVTVVLSVLNALLVTGKTTLSMGFAADGSLLPPVPASYLLLLPILGLIIYVSDVAAGLYFFPRGNKRYASYGLWGAGIISVLFLILASLIFISTAR